MNAYEAILKRRSIRKFKDKMVSDLFLDKLMKAAMAAPSARNSQPWKFYIVKNAEKRSELVKIFRDFNAPVMVVVAGDMSKLADNKTDFWVQDCAAATQNILLTAEHLGLGTCWCGVYPKEPATKQVKEILNLEEGIIPLSLIQLGYKDEEKEARTQYAKERVVEIK